MVILGQTGTTLGRLLSPLPPSMTNAGGIQGKPSTQPWAKDAAVSDNDLESMDTFNIQLQFASREKVPSYVVFVVGEKKKKDGFGE